MKLYKGIQINLRLAATLPQQIAHWLSKHTQGTGNMEPINRFMTAGAPYFTNWKGGSFRLVEDDPIHGTYFHLQTAGSTDNYAVEHLSFFLHEIQPWSRMKEGEIIARVVDEHPEAIEEVFYYDHNTSLVEMRKGRRYTSGDSVLHPKDFSEIQMHSGLGTLEFTPNAGGAWMKRFHYPTNATVSPKQETKRILARQHNERLERTAKEQLAAEIAALEGK